MLNWLTKLMGSSDKALPPAPARTGDSDAPDAHAHLATTPIPAVAEPASSLATAVQPAAHGSGDRHAVATFNVQTAATCWLFDLPRGRDANSANGRLTLELLADMLERLSLETTRAADWVPRVPAILPKLLRSLRDEHASATDLAQLIEQDVALLAEALKEVNSALHQRDNAVSRTEDAVRILGTQGLRLLLARVAFRPVIGPDAGPLTRAGATRVWSLGDTCAQVSRALAEARGVDPFEAFLSALAYNVGPLAAMRMADRMSHLARPDPHGLGPRKLPIGESAAITTDDHTAQDITHVLALLSHRVAARWELPENVIGSITAQIDPLAARRWPAASELLAVAQETARLKMLSDAGLLPAPLTDCWHHLPDDAQQWLSKA